MIIVWGTKTFEKRLARSKTMIRCEHCGNEAFWSYIQLRKWMTLYWIPLLPTPAEMVFRCPACSFGIYVTEENRDRILPLLEMK